MNDLYKSMEDYLSKTERHLDNPIIKSFFDNPEHAELIREAIFNPTDIAKKRLDDAFREFYFNIRFTTYLSQSIYFNAINFDKKAKLFSGRNLLILDRPLREGQDKSFLDLLSSPGDHEFVIDSAQIEDHLACDSLYEGIQQLTPTQRQVLNFAYVYGLSDSEIASLQHKSQQAVSKSHKQALRKLREWMETDKEGRGTDG